MASEFAHPDDDFLRFLISHVYSGNVTGRVRTGFTPIVKRALRQFLSQQVNDSLRSAMLEIDRDDSSDATGDMALEPETDRQPVEAEVAGELVTPDDENQAFLIVKAILAEVVDPDRVTMRDVMSCCGILLDDNNRQPITRLHFNRAQYQLSLFGEDKNETRVPVKQLKDVYHHAAALRDTAARYLA